jgi:ankyrin repeat protein
VESDRSSLLAAAGLGQLAVLDWLLAHGADLKLQGAHALDNAASSGHTEAALLLNQRGVDVNSRNEPLEPSTHRAGQQPRLGGLKARGPRCRSAAS